MTKPMIDATQTNVVRMELSYNTETGAFEVKCNSKNQLIVLGMLALAAQGARPAPSTIQKAAAIPAGLAVPGHS